MVSGDKLGSIGFKYIGTPYSTMDCQAFVEKCLADCGLKIDLPGFVAFKGVTFVSAPSTSRRTAAPSVVVSGKATGRFRDCRFVGAK